MSRLPDEDPAGQTFDLDARRAEDHAEDDPVDVPEPTEVAEATEAETGDLPDEISDAAGDEESFEDFAPRLQPL